jgi:glycosyltransferase involved in cell wall biosynthesis
MVESPTAVPTRLPIFAIIPCPDPITGGVQADLMIVEQLRNLGWTVHPIFFGNVLGAAPRFRVWDQLRFNVRLIRRLRREPGGFILLEDQALSGAVGLANYYGRKYRGARVSLITYHLVFNIWRNPVRRWVRRLVEGIVARGADVVIASSQSTRRELLDLGIRDDRVAVVPLGLRSSTVDRGPTRSERIDDAIRLLSVGTVEPRKGLEYLLRALGRLLDYSWQFDIIGGFDAAHHLVLVDLTRSLGISDRIHFHGRVIDEELEAFMGEADVYVSPSLGEGFGLAVLEAMDRALPVVVAGAGALPELVEHERTGLVVPPEDVPALTDALRRVMADSELRRRLGRAAAAEVNGRYTWEQTGRHIDSILARL